MTEIVDLDTVEKHDCRGCIYLRFIDYGIHRCEYWGRTVNPKEKGICTAKEEMKQ